MSTHTPDPERGLGPAEATELASSWADNHGLEITSSTLVQSTNTSSRTTQATLRTHDGQTMARGLGKGFGDQATASGVYEAIEHAATNFAIPGQSDPLTKGVLPEHPELEENDKAYTAARLLGRGKPQDVVVFHELLSNLEIAQDSFCVYPRIACDISCPISPDLFELVGLSAYTATTGTAAGTSWRDSVLHGLNEVIERDAESQFLLDINMGRRSYSTVGLSADDPLQKLFLELTASKGRKGAIYLLNSMAGYVFCAVSEPTTSEGELGLGSSQHPRVALERALTELQQVQNATSLGQTWVDEGGVGLEGLDGRPNMQRIATQVFPIETSLDLLFDEIPTPGGILPSPVVQLQEKGFKSYAREVWRTYVGRQQIVVTQSLVPGLESLNNLVFGRPILPTGRLLSHENIEFLQASQ